MSASTAIGMLGESLMALLEGEMQLSPSVNVTLLAPGEAGGNRRINLFLYKIEENSFLKNQDWQVSPTDASRIVAPPLSVNLLYLMTAYANNDVESGNTTAHEILGEAMRVLHEFPILPEAYLVEGLQESREQFRIMLRETSLDDLSKIWSTFSEAFRLSVVYEVSVVQLDQSPTSTRSIPTRIATVAVPDVEVPFLIPHLSGISPASGLPGTVVTVSGEHLEGRFAYATLTRHVLAAGLAISGDSFTLTIPADAAPGFHQLRVDISKLHRSTFLFEVTQ